MLPIARRLRLEEYFFVELSAAAVTSVSRDLYVLATGFDWLQKLSNSNLRNSVGLSSRPIWSGLLFYVLNNCVLIANC